MNDYGFELLSDQYVDFEKDYERSRSFLDQTSGRRHISKCECYRNGKAQIQGDCSDFGVDVSRDTQGKNMKTRHLQASSSLLFTVMSKYEDNNLLVKQAYQEVLTYQLEEVRMRASVGPDRKSENYC
jgi:ATP-dependent Lhr-like helicase